MPYATINGLQINYVTPGNQPPLIMSGDDASHSTSSAHALRELIPGSILSPLMPPPQSSASVTAWICESVATAAKRTR
jgi:hypothetical protein